MKPSPGYCEKWQDREHLCKLHHPHTFPIVTPEPLPKDEPAPEQPRAKHAPILDSCRCGKEWPCEEASYDERMAAISLCVDAGTLRRMLAQARAEAEARGYARGKQESEEAIERIRATWPHIEVGRNGERQHPGAPTCLRCIVEEAINGPMRTV